MERLCDIHSFSYIAVDILRNPKEKAHSFGTAEMDAVKVRENVEIKKENK